MINSLFVGSDYVMRNKIIRNYKHQICKHPSFSGDGCLHCNAHENSNSLVGFSGVINMKSLLPGIIGPDPGCGVSSFIIKCEEKLTDEQLREIQNRLFKTIPTGSIDFSVFGGPQEKMQKFLVSNIGLMPVIDGLTYFCEKSKIKTRSIIDQIGTLGGGNHFIEIGNAYSFDDPEKFIGIGVTVHAGSRCVGSSIYEFFMKRAREHKVELKHEEMSFLNEEDSFSYFNVQNLLKKYAYGNRNVIIRRTFSIMNHFAPVHKNLNSMNYIACDSDHNGLNKTGLIRRGSIERNTIPKSFYPITLNAKDGVLLCKMKDDSGTHTLPSCSGRKYTKNELNNKLKDERITFDDFKKDMDGIFCNYVYDYNITKAPFVFKSLVDVEKDLEKLVEPVYIIKPVLSMKDHRTYIH